MALIDNTTSGTLFVFSVRSYVADLAAELANIRLRRRVFRQTKRELSMLPDRTLTEMGIHRSIITRVALDTAAEAHR